MRFGFEERTVRKMACREQKQKRGGEVGEDG